MGAQDSLADAAMGGNVIAGAQNGEPGGLQVWHGLEKACGDRGLLAVLLQLLAETEQDEGAPVVAFGNFHLVDGNVLEKWNRFPVFQDFRHLGFNRCPVFGEGFEECELP